MKENKKQQQKNRLNMNPLTSGVMSRKKFIHLHNKAPGSCEGALFSWPKTFSEPKTEFWSLHPATDNQIVETSKKKKKPPTPLIFSILEQNQCYLGVYLAYISTVGPTCSIMRYVYIALYNIDFLQFCCLKIFSL